LITYFGDFFFRKSIYVENWGNVDLVATAVMVSISRKVSYSSIML
jgi:hypothetical protein